MSHFQVHAVLEAEALAEYTHPLPELAGATALAVTQAPLGAVPLQVSAPPPPPPPAGTTIAVPPREVFTSAVPRSESADPLELVRDET